MSNVVFILKQYSVCQSNTNALGCLLCGIYTRLSFSQKQIVYYTEPKKTNGINRSKWATKFYTIEEYRVIETEAKSIEPYSEALQTWTYLPDGQLYLVSQRTDKIYQPIETKFNVGDWVEIVSPANNCFYTGIVGEAPASQLFLDKYNIKDPVTGCYDYYTVYTNSEKICNRPSFVFPSSEPLNETYKKILEQEMQQRKEKQKNF